MKYSPIKLAYSQLLNILNKVLDSIQDAQESREGLKLINIQLVKIYLQRLRLIYKVAVASIIHAQEL